MNSSAGIVKPLGSKLARCVITVQWRSSNVVLLNHSIWLALIKPLFDRFTYCFKVTIFVMSTALYTPLLAKIWCKGNLGLQKRTF